METRGGQRANGKTPARTKEPRYSLVSAYVNQAWRLLDIS